MKKTASRSLAALLAGTTLSVALTGCAVRPTVAEPVPAGTERYQAKFSYLSSTNGETTTMIHSTTIQIPEVHEAVYTATVTYAEGDALSLKFGDAELFAMGEDSFRVCGSQIQGSFCAGSYAFKVTVNPTQQLLLVDITLPDGGTLRRGSYEFLGGDTFCWYGTRGEAVTGADVQYAAVTPAAYEVSKDKDVVRGFPSKVYNLITSFDDASTTRLFAWTARDSFIKDTEGMALQYRAKGETEWKQVDARQMVENTEDRRESFFKADLVGLTPDTEYEYKIGLKGMTDSGSWSQTYTFKTAPAEIGSFRFVAVGDTQSGTWSDGYTYCRAAVQLAMQEASDAAFMLNAGDVTDWGADMSMWNWYFQAIGKYAPTLPHFATVGNHDSWTEDLNNYFSLHFNHPDNGANPFDSGITDQITDTRLRVQVENPEDTVYSYDYGDVHFIVLNSGSYVAEDEYLLEAQRQWLISDLEANKDAKWKIIMVHEPVYHRKGGGEDRPWLYDVIEAYGVDLVLQGHSHLVTRTYPMKNGEIVTKASPDLIEKGIGTVYTTIGSTALNHDTAGANTVEECLLIATPESRQATYTVVSVEEDSLTVTVKQLNGLVVDTFTIQGESTPDEPDSESLPEEGPDTDGNTDGNTDENVDKTDVEPKDAGCGSVLTAGAATSGTILGAAVGLFMKKKKE